MYHRRSERLSPQPSGYLDCWRPRWPACTARKWPRRIWPTSTCAIWPLAAAAVPAQADPKRVYLVTGLARDGQTLPFILKHFLPIRLAYLPPGTTVAGADASSAGLDARLL